MKIKNIQDYRKYYKLAVRDQPTREEDFIGNFYIDQDTRKKKFGWFEIYHGDKEGYGKAEAGIENFLQSFLDMARDGQAVYEFLQNAVDAHSTHFTMVWGQDETDGNHYLLVANNGDMFSFNSVRSILNVGSSTKSADSQTIGKFGIGFKLAHRLVGKDNGLQELLHENSGPLLFSWANHDLKALAEGSIIDPQPIAFEPTEDQQHRVTDINPWLFKILITCFPCLPENGSVAELPRLADGTVSQENPFSAHELQILRNWVKKHLHALDETTYKEGSLFFIRLGKGKDADLSDNNLREGVKFSLAVLNKTADREKSTKVLSTVQLNDGEAIQIPDLKYLKFEIGKENELSEYIYIRFGVESEEELQRDQKEKLARESDIEILIGFKAYDEIGSHFAGAPNFYLYFPLSEEVHNFNYILHCNAFYKGSSRTFLHRGSKGEDGINERLLTKIAERLLVQMQTLGNSDVPDERRLFLDLYGALLSSGESINQERLWIKAPYIDEVKKNMKQMIPVRSDDGFILSDQIDDIFIKDTNIGVTLGWLEEEIKWFYWDTDFPEFCDAASIKLGLKRYDIFSLLQNENIYVHLNEWLAESPEHISVLLKELSVNVANELKTEHFIFNFTRLKMLEFSDGKTLSLLELYEMESDGYVILHNNWSTISDLLLRLKFKVSKLDFNQYHIIAQYQNWLSEKSQLKEHKIMTRLFSAYAKDEDLNQLTNDEKFRIFKAVRDLNSSNLGDRLKELKLYNNKSGRPAYFKNLLQETDQEWLTPYVIDEKAYNPELRFYLISKPENVYEAVIYPFWPKISAKLIPEKFQSVLEKITEYFALYKPEDGVKQLLSDHSLLFFQNKSVPVNNLFFSSELSEISANEYFEIQKSLIDHYQIQIPDRFFLAYADQQLFKLPQSRPELNDSPVQIPKKALSNILEFCRHAGVDIFGRLVITGAGELFQITGKNEQEQYYTTNPALAIYADKYYEGNYVALPQALNAFRNLLHLDHDAFANNLIEFFASAEDNLERELDLFEALLRENITLRLAGFNTLGEILLDTSWAALRQNKIYLSLIDGILQLEPETLTAIHEVIVLTDGDEKLKIGAIDQANDSIPLKRGEISFKISQAELLNLPDKGVIRLVKEFAEECVSGHHLSQANADQILKLSGSGISDELVQKFLGVLTDKLLTNNHQLAFVWLSDKFSAEEIIKFSIYDAGNVVQELNGPWLISGNDNTLYKNSYVLGEAYNDLPNLISLSATSSFQYGDEARDVLLPSFLFVNGCEPVVLNSESPNIFLLDELLLRMQQTPGETFKQEQSAQNWEEALHFNPKDYVLHELITDSEKLPDEILKWLDTGNKPTKTKLLTLMGVSGPGSKIVSLRKWLIQPSSAPKPEVDIALIPDSFLYETLMLLTAKAVMFTQNDVRLGIIEAITGKLVDEAYESFPVIVHKPGQLFVLADPDSDDVHYLPSVMSDNLTGQSGLENLFDTSLIVFTKGKYADQILEFLDELPVIEEYFTEGEPVEHSEPFYKQWKAGHEIILNKVRCIRSKVFTTVDEEDLFIGEVLSDQQYTLDEKVISYNQGLTLEQLSEQISETDEDISEALDELIEARDKALANFYHMMSVAETPEGEAGMYRAIQKAMQEENSRSERQGYLDEMNSAEKYSYQWFISFLEYLITYEQLASTTAQRSLNFQSIGRFSISGVVSEKYFMLYGAANLIPVNVDSFRNFSISLVFRNRKKETIKIDGVSARGQDMMIFCPNGLPAEILDSLDHVVNVSIAFSPTMNLLSLLYSAFKSDAIISPWENIQDALPPLEFIYGPPGTGKTTTICTMLAAAYEENPQLRCLLLTPTNKAADVVVKKVLQLDSGLRPVRISSVTDPELEEIDEDIYQSSLLVSDADYYNLIATTMHRYPYFKLLGDLNPDVALFQLNNHWDFVIIDEASMVSLPYMVFILMSMAGQEKMPRIIIAGDPMQIPPVLDLSDKDMEDTDVADMTIYSMLSIKSFVPEEQILRPIDSIQNLNKQYRSVEAIGRLFSKISYKDRLSHCRDFEKEPVKILPPAVANILSGPINFVNFPLKDSHAIYEHRKLFFSAYHLYAGMLVAELINFFDKAGPKEVWNIGVVTPYKAQALITNKLIRAKKLSANVNIICDTVHSFQGDQCDLIIFVVNPNNWRYTGHDKCLLTKDYVYNVAISRARDYLWILNPFNNLSNPHVIKMQDVNAAATGRKDVRQNNEIERQLFGESGYLEEYSFVAGHDNINIYGHSEMKYFIRLNELAVDVQVPGS
jgi:hypothetical protein